MNATYAQVVVVEDDVSFAEVLETVLQDAGLTVGRFTDPEAALAHMRKHGFPELLLSDLHIRAPYDGWDLLERVSALGPPRRMGRALMTGWDCLPAQREELRIDAVWTKPFALQELQELLERLRVGRRRTPRRSEAAHSPIAP